MVRTEPSRMHKNVYARLNGILKMLCILEKDYERKERNRPTNPVDIEYDLRLQRAAADIRELRRDAQRMALQAGEEVAVWWANRNKEVMSCE